MVPYRRLAQEPATASHQSVRHAHHYQKVFCMQTMSFRMRGHDNTFLKSRASRTVCVLAINVITRKGKLGRFLRSSQNVGPNHLSRCLSLRWIHRTTHANTELFRPSPMVDTGRNLGEAMNACAGLRVRSLFICNVPGARRFARFLLSRSHDDRRLIYCTPQGVDICDRLAPYLSVHDKPGHGKRRSRCHIQKTLVLSQSYPKLGGFI